MELHLPESRRRNMVTTQYHRKRFKNKHARSSWRHHNNKKYYKQFLSHKQNDSIQKYLNMDCNDIFSEYQQDLEHKLNNNCYSYNGKLTNYSPWTETSKYQRDKKQKYLQMKQKCINFVDDLNYINDIDYCYLLDLQITNYPQNYDGFLDNKNWAIYHIKTKTFKHLHRAFGTKYVEYMEESDATIAFMSYSFYAELSRTYYRSHKENNLPSQYGTTQQHEIEYIDIKNEHCNMILNKIYCLGKSSMNRTLNALYLSLPLFPCDICLIIMDYMKPFPQIPPKPCSKEYNANFDADDVSNAWVAHKFRISRTALEIIYPWYYLRNNIKICFDDADVDCQFDVDDIDTLDTTQFKEYRLKEIYHAYKFMNKLVIVGQLQPDSLFIYLDYGDDVVTLIISKFWMDLWHKIASNCIKVDCYGNTKFPQDCIYDNDQNEKNTDIIYEYE